jgi:Flp pilus assembly pilin Flp
MRTVCRFEKPKWLRLCVVFYVSVQCYEGVSMTMFQKLWNDEAGITYTIEVLLVGTIASLGLIVGLATLRDSVTNELADLGGAVDDLVQSYTVGGIQGHSSAIAGFDFQDELDYCNTPDDTTGVADECVVINTVIIEEGAAPPAGSI